MSGARLMRRLAREARKLAYECAEGTAPPLIAGHFVLGGQFCALGLALSRCNPKAGPDRVFDTLHAAMRAAKVDNSGRRSFVVEANNNAPPHMRHAAVVFPLLAFADEADEAARLLATPPGAP